MKKYAILALLLALSVNTVYAQSSSMTDDQVMRYVVKEHDKGTSNAQIVTKLMQQGVEISQIRRVRNKYEWQDKARRHFRYFRRSARKDVRRLRTNNGKTREDYTIASKKAENYSNYRVNAKEDANFAHTYDENDKEYMQFQNEMDYIIPDSTMSAQASSC